MLFFKLHKIMVNKVTRFYGGDCPNRPPPGSAPNIKVILYYSISMRKCTNPMKQNVFNRFHILIRSLSGRGATALHFEGVIFMNFHSMTSSNYVIDAYSTVVQLFRKRLQICSFRYISENENLLVLIRPVTRGAKPTLKFFRPLGKMCWT